MKLRSIALTLCVLSLSVHTKPVLAGDAEKHTDPYSKDQWRPSEEELAVLVKRDLLILQAAVQQYGAEFKKPENAPVSFNDIKVYLRDDSRLFRSRGKDILGNPYLFTTIQASVAVSADTTAQLRTIPFIYWKNSEWEVPKAATR
jgi:hypothetical protein